MVVSSIADRRPFWPAPEDGVGVKGECPRCKQERHMFPDALACSGCLTPDEVPSHEDTILAERIADIRRRRDALGITRQELIERAGIARQTLAFIETGRRHRPEEDTLTWIEGALAYFEEKLPRVEDLKLRRKALRFRESMTVVAERAGMSVGGYAKIENGETKRPGLARLLKIKNAIDDLEQTVPKGEDLKRRRESLGISMWNFYLASGVPQTTIWSVETGVTKRPFLSTLKRISSELDRLEERLARASKVC